MKNRILAVCDPEEAYAERLMEYLSGRPVNPFYVRAFTSPDTLREFAAGEEVEVLLADAGLEEARLQGIPAGKRIWLCGRKGLREREGEASIYKYQSAERIIREVLYYYAEDAQPFLQAALLREDVRMYGVYSPVHRLGKTAFALALASVCAGKRRTLYLNLEAYSGFGERLSSVPDWNLGDLLYFLRRGRQGFLFKLKSMTGTIGELDYIAPVLSPEDLLTVTEEEWEAFLERLIADADYGCLVLDFSDCIQGLAELLGKCSRVYMPVCGDTAAQAKLAQFDRMLDLKGCAELRASIRRIHLPPPGGLGGYVEIPEEYRSLAQKLEEDENG